MGKIFGIGFHKTGTKSLARALRVLGYTVTGPNGVKDPDIARNLWTMIEELLPQYDAFQDNPWPIVFRELDAKCPGSRFILTVRDPSSWLKSQVGYFGAEDTPMRRWIYGDAFGHPDGNEQVYLERYARHNREVMDYFRDRPGDLLVMDFAAGDGWEKLCRFLDRPVPKEPFPHMNRRGGGAAASRSLWSRIFRR